MLLSKNSARKRCCPYSVVRIQCRANRCMAWRWKVEYKRIDGKEGHEEPKRGFFGILKYYLWDVLIYEPKTFSETYKIREPLRGYCGLAGKPR